MEPAEVGSSEAAARYSSNGILSDVSTTEDKRKGGAIGTIAGDDFIESARFETQLDARQAEDIISNVGAKVRARSSEETLKTKINTSLNIVLQVITLDWQSKLVDNSFGQVS